VEKRKDVHLFLFIWHVIQSFFRSIRHIIKLHCMHTVHIYSLLLQILHVVCKCVLSVCVLVTPVCFAQMAEPIEIPFGELTHVGPRNHVLQGIEIR